MESIETLLYETLEKEEPLPHVINPENLKKLVQVYHILKTLTKNTNASINHKIAEPFLTMGSISILAESVSISQTQLLSLAVTLSDCVDIYPRTDGKIAAVFTFHGITRPIER